MRASFSMEKRRGIRHLAPALIVGVCGFVLSVGTWHMMVQSETRATIREFDIRANNQAIILENWIHSYWGELYAVQDLFQSSNQDVTREESENFAGSLIGRHSAIMNIAWAPRIERDECAAHEQLGAREGLRDYHIRGNGRNGSLPVAPERDEYFPKFYSTDPATVYGLDLNDGATQARKLEIEITELVLMQDNELALATLHRIKELGVSIAMDDFGTGYSSLGYLRSFPFDRIKIDQSFIRDLSRDKDSLAILRAVVGLGRSLGIVTTAEGVETRDQLEILKSEGCTDAQGYLFSHPQSAADVEQLLTALDGPAKAVA
jgi:hypothetical protein